MTLASVGSESPKPGTPGSPSSLPFGSPLELSATAGENNKTPSETSSGSGSGDALGAAGGTGPRQVQYGWLERRESEAKMREALTASLTADIAAAANEAARDKKDDGKEARIRDGWRASLTAEIGAAAREAAKKRASEIVKVDDPNLSFRV